MSHELKFQCNKCGTVATIEGSASSRPIATMPMAQIEIRGGDVKPTTVTTDIHLCKPCVRLLAEFIPSIKADLERFYESDITIDFSVSERIKEPGDGGCTLVRDPAPGIEFKPRRIVIENPEHFVVLGFRIMDRDQLRDIPPQGIPAAVFGANVAPVAAYDYAVGGSMLELYVRYVGPDPSGEPFRARIEGTVYGFSPAQKKAAAA